MNATNILDESIQTIAEYLSVSEETAQRIRALINRDMNPDSFDSVDKWRRQCYNEPTTEEKIQCALNELIEGYGTEAIETGNYVNSFFGHIGFVYINTGDTYNPTIIYNTSDDFYFLGTWGDVVEPIDDR